MMRRAFLKAKTDSARFALAIVLAAAVAVLGSAAGFGGVEEYYEEQARVASETGMIQVGVAPEGGQYVVWSGSGAYCVAKIHIGFYRPGDKGTFPVLSKLPLRVVEPVNGKAVLCEGCEGGKRRPSPRADDDGDGLIDEDRVDGRDNDGDGLIDEDFAAIGERMFVAEVVPEKAGPGLIENTYVWKYEHADDFAGFSTAMEGGGGFFDAHDEGRSEWGGILIGVEFEVRGEKDESGFTRGSMGVYSDIMEDTVRAKYIYDGGIYASLILLDRGLYSGGKITGGTPEGPRSLSGQEENAATFKGDGFGEGSGRELTIRVPIEDRGIQGEAGTAVSWAVVFAESLEGLGENIQTLFKTYEGIPDGAGSRARWVVPATKAGRIELESNMVTVWMDNENRRAVVMKLPPELAGTGIKWMKADGERREDYTKSGMELLLPLAESAAKNGDTLLVEGQFDDGVFFRSRALLIGNGYVSSDSSTGNNRLPGGFLKLHPNPFVDEVSVSLNISRDEEVFHGGGAEVLSGRSSVRIYDVKGLLVRVLMEREFLPPGMYSVSWNGKDERGARVAPGVYYCSLQIGERAITKRVILLR